MLGRMGDAELVWDVRCAVGESPVWDEKRRRLLFCDIPAGRIHAFCPDEGRRTSWDLPDVVGSFGLCRSGRLVVALRDRVVLFDTETHAIAPLAGPVDEPPTNRFNDGKVGPDGCFWVGSMDERAHKQPLGALYRVTPDGAIERKAGGCLVSNGLAWSADGRTMFHSDSRAARIDAWDFDPATGRVGDRRRIASPTAAEGRPDGGACDAEGCYWSAGVSAGRLNRFSPTGALLNAIRLPLPAPTMPCFAGRWLYVTTLREGQDADALARFPALGGLLRLPAPAVGVPVGLFAD